jgi:two-component system chemotaxis response regulator CheB
MADMPTKKLRVLIVDDSSFMRLVIRGILSRETWIDVVGTAADGFEGVEKAAQLAPDFITMDIEMPRKDGITAVREITARYRPRIIMVSTLTREGARATFDALDAGATDFITKFSSDSADAREALKNDLLRKAREAHQSLLAQAAPPLSPAAHHVITTAGRLASGKPAYVGIGASTGGPVAVQELLSSLPATIRQPIMVVIHMPRAFTGPYAERLNGKCQLQVREAVDGDYLTPGQVLLAPGGQHTTLVRQGTRLMVRTATTESHPKSVYIPSVDIMLSTLADAAAGPTLGVILTGMGNDGLAGMRRIKEKGGTTLVQDQATSIIYGMPRACIEAGIADLVLPLGQIGPALSRIATSGTDPAAGSGSDPGQRYARAS